jgi:hypothetical protein
MSLSDTVFVVVVSVWVTNASPTEPFHAEIVFPIYLRRKK